MEKLEEQIKDKLETKEETKLEEVVEKHEDLKENIEMEDQVEEKEEQEGSNETVSGILNPEEEPLEQEEKQPPKKDKLRQYTIIIAIICAILLIGLAIFSTAFALVHKAGDKIANGVVVNGINVSGLTQTEAYEKLYKQFEDKKKENIVLKHGEFETSLTPEQIEMNYGVEEAVKLAYGVGRSEKLLKDNYALFNANFSNVEIHVAYQYNEKTLDDYITSTQGNLPDIVKQSGYSVDGNKLVITKGEKGIVIEQENLKNAIIASCNQITDSNIQIKIPTSEQEPEKIDLAKIHNEIYKEAQDAYYTKDPFTVHPHIEGVDFDISMEEAQNLLNSDANEVTIPLKIIKPKKTTNQIGSEAFPDLLASYSTTFATSNTNRTTNIKLSSNKINGVVLMPGETFSYNKVVGQRTAAKGYKTAAVYVGGKVEQGIGGGICQVSSTLYNTALRANLQIVSRSNHRFATGYVPLSTDATVSWGGPEFVFKNSRKYPVKIVSTVNGGKITVSMYGCKEETEYEVQIKSETLQTIPTKVTYRTNTSLPKGTSKTVQKGHSGYKSRAYRILKLNGKVVSKQLLSTDTYAQLETIIEQNK